jgi:outer membrane protein OmpA-like peptidoglycan-associated protein
MRFRSALLAATVLAVPFAAQAQPINGLYVSAGAGVNLKNDIKIKNLSVSNPITGAPVLGGVNVNNADLTSGPGPVALGAVGWGFGNGLRAELEFAYRNNYFQKVTHDFAGIGVAPSGREQLYGPMVNVAYDFYGLTPYVVPYIGAGIGGMWGNLKDFNIHANGVNGGEGAIATGDNTVAKFAYQVIVGVAFPIGGLPGLSLTAEYRFLGTSGNRNYNVVGASNVIQNSSEAIRVRTGSVELGSDYNNAFLIGLRFAFGVAPPPPAPAPVAAPAPAPARSYLVFFDWDKATLTDRARQIIKEAADNSTHVQYTQIVVNGYTDTSGTAQYNMGLSIRRANAVAAELVRDGVPKNVISIHGFGETHLLVPTGNGVREPQNRRVEIIIQ